MIETSLLVVLQKVGQEPEANVAPLCAGTPTEERTQ